MWYKFFLENAHFAVNLLASLVFFAVFWLYFDAWLVKKPKKELFKILGFISISISYLVHASVLEVAAFKSFLFSEDFYAGVMALFRIIGYILVIIGLATDKLEKEPRSVGLKQTGFKALIFTAGSVSLGQYLPVFFPILAAITGFLYLRRATIGLENHLKPVALAFYIIALAELLSLGVFFRNSAYVALFNFTVALGPL